MRQLVEDLLTAEGIAMRGSRFGTVTLEGESYTQVPLIVDFECQIEQFVNWMAAVANAPQLLSHPANPAQSWKPGDKIDSGASRCIRLLACFANTGTGSIVPFQGSHVMSRKLLLINAMLLGLLILGVAEFVHQVQGAQQRYELLSDQMPAKEVPAYPAPALPPRVRQRDYMPVVDRLLFSQDRNPIVEVEVPPPAEVEQRPDLPLLVGLMDLGNGPIAMMAANSKGTPRPVGIGEKVGDFTFVAAAGDVLTLEWKGRQFEATEAELTGASGAEPTVKARVQTRAAARRPARKSTTRLGADKSKSVSTKHYIGPPLSGQVGRRSADSSDGLPDGTESDGFTRRVRETPFGAQHWWEKTQK